MATIQGTNNAVHWATVAPGASQESNEQSGVVRLMSDTINFLASGAADDDVHIIGAPLPVGAKVIAVFLQHQAYGTSVTVDVGTHTYDGTTATAVNQDSLIDGYDGSSAGGTSSAASAVAGTYATSGPLEITNVNEHISLTIASSSAITASAGTKVLVLYAMP